MDFRKILLSMALVAACLAARADVFIMGDVNRDQAVDVGDVNSVLEAILAGGEPDLSMDLNGDGLVDVGDTNAILDLILSGERRVVRTGYDYVWNEESETLAEIHIDVSLEEWNNLLKLYDANPQTTQYVMANVTYVGTDGVETRIEGAGLRLKGNTSRRRPEGNTGEMHRAGHTDWHHCHFGIHLRKYFKDEEHTIQGVRKLHLKWAKDDPTYVREMFCYDMFRRAGVWTGTRGVYCRLWLHVEGDEQEAYYGVYELLEPIDENWLKQRDDENTFGTHEGNLWKCRYTRHQASLTNEYGGDYWYDDDSDDKHVYTLETNTKRFDDAKAQLIDFQLKLIGKKDDSFRKWITEVCDVDLLLHTYAVNVALGMWDDYWNNGNNYYLYFTTEDLYDYKVYLIPYDYDNTLGTSNNCGVQNDSGRQDPLRWGNSDPNNWRSGSPLIARLLQFEDWKALYVKYLKEAVAQGGGLMHYDDAVARIRRWQRIIAPYVSNDTGEDMELRDEPAGWGNHHEYRLLGGDFNTNFFRVKAATINALP